jgi:hypothetical protein
VTARLQLLRACEGSSDLTHRCPPVKYYEPSQGKHSALYALAACAVKKVTGKCTSRPPVRGSKTHTKFGTHSLRRYAESRIMPRLLASAPGWHGR